MLVFHFVELRKLPRLAFFANFFIVVAAGVGGIEVKSFVNPFEMSVKGHQNKIQYIKGKMLLHLYLADHHSSSSKVKKATFNLLTNIIFFSTFLLIFFLTLIWPSIHLFCHLPSYPIMFVYIYKSNFHPIFAGSVKVHPLSHIYLYCRHRCRSCCCCLIHLIALEALRIHFFLTLSIFLYFVDDH